MNQEIMQKLTNSLMDGIDFIPLETDLLELEEALKKNGLEIVSTTQNKALLEALEKIAKGEYNSLSANPAEWASTIAKAALDSADL